MGRMLHFRKRVIIMIPVSIPYVAINQKKYVNDCLKRNWISAFGKYDSLLCKKFSAFVGSKFASTCSNGTVAIHLALLAAGVKKGDEVILPNFNGPYALFACSYVSATPVLIDIDDSWDIDIDELKKAISKKTKAIIVPHLYGIPTKLIEIAKYCKSKNIIVIEDCAEAHGAKENQSMVGSIGDIGCFSFYANKIIASGEGGIITTSNKSFFKKIEYYKNQTFNSGPIKTFRHKEPGYNYRMSDLHCAIAYSHLEEIDHILEERNKIIALYKKHLPKYASFFQMHKDGCSNVNWVTTFQLPKKLSKYRNKLELFLTENNIQVRRYFATMDKQPFLKKMLHRKIGDLKKSNQISNSGIYLPTYIGIQEKKIKKVCLQINNFFDGIGI